MSSEVPPEAAAEEALPPLIEVSGTALSSSLMIYVVGFVALSVLGGAAYYFLVSKNRNALEPGGQLDNSFHHHFF